MAMLRLLVKCYFQGRLALQDYSILYNFLLYPLKAAYFRGPSPHPTYIANKNTQGTANHAPSPQKTFLIKW